jgi:hypothetical protein
MSIIYQYLDVDNHELISNRLHQYVLEHTDVLQKNENTFVPWNTLKCADVLRRVPELPEALMGVFPANISMVSIFYAPAGFAGGVHVDAGDVTYRVLWPVHNCKGSYTKFFDRNGNDLIEMVSGEKDPFFLVGNKYPLKEIASAETIAPLVLHVKTPHGIYTNPNHVGPRLTATIGFDRDIRPYL